MLSSHAWHLSSIPVTNMMKGNNWPLEIVFWTAQTCCGIDTHNCQIRRWINKCEVLKSEIKEEIILGCRFGKSHKENLVILFILIIVITWVGICCENTLTLCINMHVEYALYSINYFKSCQNAKKLNIRIT